MPSDTDLLNALKSGDVCLDALDLTRVQPCSIDLTLASQYRLFDPVMTRIDQAASLPVHHLVQGRSGRHHAAPRVGGADVDAGGRAAQREPRRAGRRQVQPGATAQAIHVTAGVIEGTCEGTSTLELVDHAPFEVVCHPEMPTS